MEKNLFPLKNRAEEVETLALQQVKKAIKKSATELYFESGQSQEATQQLWEARVNQERAAFKELWKKSRLSYLRRSYNKAIEAHDSAKAEQNKQRDFLDQYR